MYRVLGAIKEPTGVVSFIEKGQRAPISISFSLERRLSVYGTNWVVYGCDERGRRMRTEEEDREIVDGSGEIVTRAGGQIISVRRGSPSYRLYSFLSLSLSCSLVSFLLKVSDRATMSMSAFI